MLTLEEERDPLELLVTEFLERRRRGESPHLNEYLEKYPDLKEDILELFPTILAMEGCKEHNSISRNLASRSSRTEEVQLPEWLGDYRVLGEIGRGGMGIVLEAEHQSLGRRVAVKVLPRHSTLEPKHLARFKQEAQMAARLHHTNIVPVFGVGEQGGLHFYVMQLIRGVGLDEVLQELRRTGPLPSSLVESDSGGEDQGRGAEHAECKTSHRVDSARQAARSLLEGGFGSSATLGPGLFESKESIEQRSTAPADHSRCRAPLRDQGGPPPEPADAQEITIALSKEQPAEGLQSGEELSVNPGEGSSHQEGSGGANAGTLPARSQKDSRYARSERSESLSQGPAEVEVVNLSRPSNKVPRRGSAHPDTTTVPPVRVGRCLKRYWKGVARLGVQVADALHYAHLQKTVHRDVKPGNLLLDAQGVIWLTDFGLARPWDQESLSRTTDIVGTLLYVDPEQIEGKPSNKSDIYSLGATLYELLTLQPPFTETNQAQLMQNVLEGNFPRPRTIRPDIPRDLETIVLKAMTRDPQQRYSTAGDLRDDLRRFLDDRPIRARRAWLVERFWRWCRRNRAVATLATTAFALLILLALLATAGYFQSRQAHQNVQQALEAEQNQRTRAENNARLAQQALDKIFQRFAFDRVPVAPQLTIEGDQETEVYVPVQPALSREDASLLEELLGYYEQLAQQAGQDGTLRRKVAAAHWRIGDIRSRLGQPDLAIAAYQRSLELHESLRTDYPKDWLLIAHIANIHNQLGHLQAMQSKFRQQKAAHLKALAVLDTIPQQPSLSLAPRVLYERARSHYLLARAGRGRPGFRKPRGLKREPDHLQQAIEILEDLGKRYPGVPDYRFLLALCYRVEPRTQPHRPGSIFAAADKAAQLLRKLVDSHPGVPEYRHELIETYARVPHRGPFFSREFLAGRETRLVEMVALADALALEHPHEPRYRSTQARVHRQLAEVRVRTNQHTLADKSFRKALLLRRQLVRQFPENNSYKFQLLFVQDSYARLLSKTKKWKEARKMLENSIRLREQSTRWVKLPYSRWFLADNYRRLSAVLKALGEKEKADQAARKWKEMTSEQRGK